MDLIVTKKLIKYQNNKPWITKELKSIINNKKLTYFTGDLQEGKLEKPQCRARILFADFLCTFNKMQPHILFDCHASYFELPNQFLVLLLNFLTNRIQRVLVNGHTSSIRLSSTGSPQRCVRLLVLFILYKDSCRSSQEGSFVIVKFSDDSALLTLLQAEIQIMFRPYPPLLNVVMIIS